jgi:hypothetical protein
MHISSYQRIQVQDCVTFLNKLFSYGEETLAPHATPKLEDHPSSAVPDSLCNRFRFYTAYLDAVPSKTQAEHASCRGDVDALYAKIKTLSNF